jgi:hypothetical protein
MGSTDQLDGSKKSVSNERRTRWLQFNAPECRSNAVDGWHNTRESIVFINILSALAFQPCAALSYPSFSTAANLNSPEAGWLAYPCHLKFGGLWTIGVVF